MSAVADESDLAALKLLADPVRARIVALLAREQLCTCHLVEALPVSQSGVSNHLRLLREAGVVEAEPCGRFTYYRLRPEALRALGQRLTALADDAVAAPRRAC